MIDFEELFQEYQQLIRLKDYRTGNGRQYIQAVEEFFGFLKSRGYAYFEITGSDMADYYEYLIVRPNERRGGTLSNTTINHYLYAIKLLFNFLYESKQVDALPVLPNYQSRKRQIHEVLSVEEVKLMYQETKTKLERAVLSGAYGCGLRRNELANLMLSDLDLKKGILIVRNGKGSKRREVPMSEKVIEDFKSYIYEERRTSHKLHHVYITPHGNAMSGYYMNETIKKIKERVVEVGKKVVTLHTLRRSIATHLTENGASIYFVKDFLGHVDIDTSELYTIRRKRQTKIT